MFIRGGKPRDEQQKIKQYSHMVKNLRHQMRPDSRTIPPIAQKDLDRCGANLRLKTMCMNVDGLVVDDKELEFKD